MPDVEAPSKFTLDTGIIMISRCAILAYVLPIDELGKRVFVS